MIQRIMHEENGTAFILETNRTTYAFRVMPTGQLEHLYYGRKIRIDDISSLIEKHAFAPGNTIIYDEKHPEFSLEDICLETSARGKGDIREPMVEVKASDGNTSLDFAYVTA